MQYFHSPTSNTAIHPPVFHSDCPTHHQATTTCLTTSWTDVLLQTMSESSSFPQTSATNHEVCLYPSGFGLPVLWRCGNLLLYCNSVSSNDPNCDSLLNIDSFYYHTGFNRSAVWVFTHWTFPLHLPVSAANHIKVTTNCTCGSALWLSPATPTVTVTSFLAANVVSHYLYIQLRVRAPTHLTSLQFWI